MNYSEMPVTRATGLPITEMEESWLKTLTRFSVDLIGYDDELKIAWFVAKEIVASLGFNDCVVYFIDHDRQILRQVAAIGDKNPKEFAIANRLEIPIGAGITGYVAQHLTPERIGDVAKDPRYIQDILPARSEICVPLIVEGNAFGVIDCEEAYPDAFNADHQIMLEAIASMMSAKLELLHKTRALAESERNHRNILENIVETFYRTDSKGRVVMMSASGAGLFGSPIKDLIGRPYADLHVNPADYDQFLEQLVENDGVLARYVVRMRRGDGSEFWAANSARIYRDEAGQFLGVEGISRNITEQLEYQIDLKETQAQLIKAQRIAQLGFWHRKGRGGDLVWSDEIYRILDLDPTVTEPSNAIFLSRLHPEDRETVTRIHLESAEYGTSYSIAYRLCMPGGDIKWIQEHGHTEWIGPTRLQVNYGVAQDITRRKLLEEDLLSSLRRAEDANQAKSSFLASMSHELRTPLNAILGFSEMIQMQYFGPVGDPKYADYAKDIRESGYYLLELINDLLDISKIEAGAYRLKLEPLILRDIAAECLELVRQQSDEKNLTLSNDIPTNMPLLHLDRRAIKQIILNLLSNAVKFTPDKGRIVLIGQSAPDHLTFAVEDTGPGISDDVMPYLFQPFKTAMISNPVGTGGTGLGLTITKALVEMHNGTLFIRSKPDCGTSASVRLPRQDAEKQ